MAEATEGVPSYELKKLIAETTVYGTELLPEVREFAQMAHQAALEFAAEVDPLHLPDEDYERRAEGLKKLLEIVHRMETNLSYVHER